MGFNIRLFICLQAAATTASAAPPPALASALEFLRDQKSYSWETINADPGPVKRELETRRGTITTVQQNMAPNVKGAVDRSGNTLLERQWSDGLQLDTIVMANGDMVTKTPEGWMTNQEILTALAEERISGNTLTPRQTWLRRADRPDVRRPDEELVPFLNSGGRFEAAGDSYVAKGRVRADGAPSSGVDDGAPTLEVEVTMHVRNGIIRDYEISLEGTRPVTRARIQVPISEKRIVILTYLPINRINIPEDAREKLVTLSFPGSRNAP